MDGSALARYDFVVGVRAPGHIQLSGTAVARLFCCQGASAKCGDGGKGRAGLQQHTAAGVLVPRESRMDSGLRLCNALRAPAYLCTAREVTACQGGQGTEKRA